MPCNLVYVIEGDEERTAEPLGEFSRDHGDLLAADVLHVADSWMHEPGVPAVTTAVRGMAALDFSVSTARWNLHSGIYGGAVPNAVSVLAGLLAGLHDASGRVAVAGFYDRVAETSSTERARWAAFAPERDAYLAETGSHYLSGETPYTPLEQVWSRPTLEINGAWGGFLGDGIHTIVPARAHAKITCRLVAEQDPQQVIDQIAEHLRLHTPPGAELVIESTLAGCRPALDAGRLAGRAGRGRGARGRLGPPGGRGPGGLLGAGGRGHGAPRRGQRLPDGVRARGRAGARPRRALPPRELPQGHRGDRRLLARLRRARASA